MIAHSSSIFAPVLALLMFGGILYAQFETSDIAPPTSSLLEAVKQSNTYRSRELLAANPSLIAEQDENGETALHWAAVNGDTAIMRILILNKADVRAKARDDWTPLHWAAVKGREEAAKILIENGADVNARTRDGWTPLHVAAYQEQKRMAEILIISGADRQARDAKGLTPANTLEERISALAALLAPEGPHAMPASIDTNALANLEREAAQWHTERSSLMSDLAAALKELADIKTHPPPPQASPETEQLKQQLRTATARILDLDRQLEVETDNALSAKAEAEDAGASLYAAMGALASATQSLAEANAYIAEQQAGSDKAQTAAAELQARIDALEKNCAIHTNAALETSRLLEEARQQLETAQSKSLELRRMLGASSAEKSVLEDTLAGVKKQAEALHQQKQAAEAKLAEQIKRLEASEAETRGLRAALASSDSTSPEDLDRAIEEAAELEKKLLEEREINARLKEQIASAKPEPPSPPPPATKPKDLDVENLRRLLAVAHERIGELETQVAAAEEIKTEGERLRQRLEAMGGHNRAELALGEAENQIRGMRQKIGALEKALQDSYRVGQQLRKDAENLRSERSKLIARISEIMRAPAQPPAQTAQIQPIEQALTEAQSALAQLRIQLRLAAKDRENLERQVRSLGGSPVTLR